MKASAVTTSVFALAVGAILVLSLPAWSDEKEGKEQKAAEMAKTAKVTIDQAIKTASEKVPGTVIEAELEHKHGKTIWEVEIVSADGKVTEVHLDADSGTVIDTEMKGAGKKHEKKGKAK